MGKTSIIIATSIAICSTVTAQSLPDTIFCNEMLNEIVVVAKVPIAEVSPGKVTYMTDATITQKSGTLYDMLSSLPGVVISSDGSISIYGKSGATLLIDGKPTYLSGTDLVSMLKSLPASNSDKIDVISQPSSKYDAAGNIGVVDIRTRKIKIRGYNASIYASGNPGENNSGYISASMNIRKGKVNFFSNYSYYHGISIIDLEINRPYFESNIKGDMVEYSYRKRVQNSHFLRFGFDYDINDMTMWGVSLKGSYGNQNERSTMTDIIKNSSYINHTSGFQNNDNKDLYATTYFTHKFNGDSREISASVDYYLYDTGREQHINNELSEPMLGNMNGKAYVYSAQADLTYGMNENWIITSGAKSAIVNLNNDAGYKRLLNNNWEYDGALGSLFEYDENINALYIQSEHKINKMQLTLGIRAEDTHVKGNLSGNTIQPDSSFTTSYLSLFPNLSLQYNLNNGNSFQLTYTRRINRPNYGDLNPFTYRFNDFTADSGNTKLKPSYANNIELSYVYKSNWQIVGFFSHTADGIIKTYQIHEDNRLFAMPDNMANYIQTGIRAHIVKFSPFNWWNSNITLTGVYNRFTWKESNIDKKNKRFTPIINYMNQFTITSSWSAEVNFNYMGKFAAGQAIINAKSEVNLGIQKKIFEGMGTISLFVKDLFNGKKETTKANLYYGPMSAHSDYKERMVGISISFSFKKGTKAEEKSKKNETDEMKRVIL